MAPQWLIIADDLTGAADSALEFAKGGNASTIFFDTTSILDADVAVAACSTESRGMAPDAAVAALEGALGDTLRQVGGKDETRVYKKVDSTLRGNVGSELVATMTLLGSKVCIMAAASPDCGRTTVGGYGLLNGVPIELTSMAKDPLAPVKCSFIPSLFDGLGVNTVHVGLRDMNAGTDVLLQTFTEACEAAGQDGTQPTVVICDGATQEHLEAVAEALEQLPDTPLVCGAQGLAAALSDLDSVSTPTSKTWPKVTPGAIVVASTSHQKTTKEQIAKLKAKHPNLKELATTGPPSSATPGSILLLASPAKAQADFDAVVDQTVKTVQDCTVAGLVLGGGGLATAVLSKLGCTALNIELEVDRNTPLCRVVGGALQGLQVVTKGGALGPPDALVASVREIKANFDLGPGVGRPILGITMGDPCGVGPEIIAKALSLPDIYKKYRPVVIGDPTFMEAGIKAVQAQGFTGVVAKRVATPEDCTFTFGTIECWSNFAIKYDEVELGVVGAEAGRCAAQWVIDAVELAMADRIDAIVTAPLNKEAMHMGGFKYNGHTELLAKYSGATTSRLMLVANNLKVVHATCHVAFRNVSEQLCKPGRLETTVDMLHNFMLELGFDHPKIALAGLNPHCGDGDIYGVTEEKTVMEPCVKKCNAKPGYNVLGPIPGDTCFMRAVKGEFDAVVAMYHDEGHIPAKLMGFGDTVNVTLGLPIIRTSVDHGTAFDIAGKGIAHHSNLLTAMEFGAEMAIGRQQQRAARAAAAAVAPTAAAVAAN